LVRTINTREGAVLFDETKPAPETGATPANNFLLIFRRKAAT